MDHNLLYLRMNADLAPIDMPAVRNVTHEGVSFHADQFGKCRHLQIFDFFLFTILNSWCEDIIFYFIAVFGRAGSLLQ